ncbi:metallophosphoesterase family protein [Brevibacillus agri]|uniref:metallophosphoesterase family protein n=1 Tax=Brevibacillus TaxID=55080 RepID=UPI002E1C2DBD|nr:metallophosphoesterase family protein [Brevibacillus borstelensis]
MRKLFITDIHGDYQGFRLLLKHAELDLAKDQLVIGGDMINRGKESGEVIKSIKLLCEQYPNNVHAIIGNHEEMMGWYYQRADNLWLRHGGREAIKDFEKTFSKAQREEHIGWACGLPLVFEDDEYVYTHSGLNPYEPLDKQNREILWMSESDFYSISKENLLTLTQNRPIIHGHTPVERIYFDGVRMNCDMGSNTYCVEEERGLGLVNLSEMVYFVYKQAQKKIEMRKISHF